MGKSEIDHLDLPVLLSGGFTISIIVNLPDGKLVNPTSKHCLDILFYTV